MLVNFSNPNDSESDSEEMGLGNVIEGVSDQFEIVEKSLESIQGAVQEFIDYGSEYLNLDEQAKVVFEGLKERVRDECDSVGGQLDDVVDNLENAKSFVHPDQNKIARLESELEHVQKDFHVTLQRLEQGEGQDGFVKSKAQEKREDSTLRVQNKKTSGYESKSYLEKHHRHFSLMDMYERINKDQDSEEEESDGEEDMRIIQEKLSVTMESASHHCDVIKTVLREMLSEIGMVSEDEKNLCVAVSDSIGGSIDRIQFALDNLYDQGVEEHERAADFKKLFREKEKELEDLKDNMNEKLESIFEDNTFISQSQKKELGELLKEFGFRNTQEDIIVLQEQLDKSMQNLENTEIDKAKYKQESKIKTSQLKKVLQEFTDLRDTFDECQNELANSKSRTADLESYQEAYNVEDYQEEIENLNRDLGHARESKIRTITHLDKEIKRLRGLLDPKWTVRSASFSIT